MYAGRSRQGADKVEGAAETVQIENLDEAAVHDAAVVKAQSQGLPASLREQETSQSSGAVAVEGQVGGVGPLVGAGSGRPAQAGEGEKEQRRQRAEARGAWLGAEWIRHDSKVPGRPWRCQPCNLGPRFRYF